MVARADARAGELAILRERSGGCIAGRAVKDRRSFEKSLIVGNRGVLRRWCPEDRMKSS
jgi:hypothetical protein